jgi:hypothetical protein
MPERYSPQPDYDFARDFKGYGEEGLNPKWPNDAKIAVSFVINYEEVKDLYLITSLVNVFLISVSNSSYRVERAASSKVTRPPRWPFESFPWARHGSTSETIPLRVNMSTAAGPDSGGSSAFSRSTR